MTKRMVAGLRSVAAGSVWIVLWQLVSQFQIIDKSVLPPPATVISLMISRSFLKEMLVGSILTTFSWSGAAWFSGSVIAFIVVTALRRFQFLTKACQILFIAGRTLPSVIAVPVFAATFGSTRETAFVCAVFLVICYSVPGFDNALEFLRSLRRDVSSILGLKNMQEVLLVVLPGIGKAFQEISSQAFGIALVVTVAGEMLLSLKESAGERVAELSLLLRMTEVYALVGWLVVAALLFSVATTAGPNLLSIPSRLIARKLRSHE